MIKESNSKHQNELIFYSDYGYIRISDEEYKKEGQIVHVYGLKNKSLEGYIDKLKLRKKIVVNIKKISDERELVKYELDITCKLKEIVKMLTKDSKWSLNSQFRLFASMGYVRELNPNNKFHDETIKNNETIIITKGQAISFCESRCGDQISIQNDEAFKKCGSDIQFVMTNKGISSGIFYCEFTLLSEPDERNIFIGLSQERKDFYFEENNFWGYSLSECRKIIDGEYFDYGTPSKLGDTIGILMEFNKIGLDVTFYCNGMNLGVAFNNLKHNEYFPTVALYYEQAKVKINSPALLPDDFYESI